MGKKAIYTLLAILTLWGCSTEKNAFLNRSYHYTTTRFNGYFHGNEAFKLATKNIKNKHVDDYDYVLDIFQHGDELINKAEYSNLNRAINKAAKMIDQHSMKFKEKRETVEKNNMIDDCFLLIGKARFLKGDLESAAETFIYVQSNFQKKPIKVKASLWLIINYIEQENFVDAETQVKALKEDKELPKRFKDDLLIIEASMFIKSKEYQKAIPILKEAISLVRKRSLKHRLSFILGQLYQNVGDTKNASELYTYVAKKAANYDLQFNAKINLAKTFEGSGSEIITIFEKMLKDDKNKEYQDQIYFALAQVYEKQGNTDLAIENYKLSAANSVNNPKQKGKAFLALGDYYFDLPKYPAAAKYYDSCLIALPPNFPQYQDIQQKKNSLVDLVFHLEVVAKEDSLLKISNFSEEEKLAFADAQIEKARVKKELKELKAEEKRAQELINNKLNGTGGDSWIFNNPGMLSAGVSDFMRIWGDIKLEDNWRRSDKSSVSFNEIDQSKEIVSDVPEDQTVAFYLKDVPTSEAAIEASNANIRKSYYALGVLYRDQFEDLKQSNYYFELLNSRYPKNNKEVICYYQLYRNYDKLNLKQPRERNKELILTDYPKSEYAALLLNPNKLADQEKKLQDLNSTYQQTYSLFQAGNYQAVIDSIKSLKGIIMNTALEPRFSLLSDFAKGKLGGRDSLISNLRKTQSEFMGTTVANEIDLILGKINREQNVQKKAELDSLQKEKEFILSKSEPHYFVLIFSNETNNADELAQGISDFNSSYFSNLNLQVKSIVWSETENIIIVKPLTSEKDYYSYFSTFNDTFLKDQKPLGDLYFTISKTNYTKLFQYKEVLKYADFFNKNYSASEK